MFRASLLLLAACLICPARPLLVLSVDGLDNRYLRDAGKLGLKIPNIRKLMREGAWANGVVGVVPTVTWPSHTTLISGVPPSVHGILNNRRPRSEGGEYYWSSNLLRVPTLLNTLRSAGRKSAAITWPVTVDAPVDFNMPEYFQGRNGGAMDLKSIASKSSPGLVDEIAAKYPSFPKQWMDDRARAQATMFLLEQKKPDLILVHFVDLDSEAHENGPFSRESNAILEYTDELIGGILRVLPKEYAFALVSDHGFELTKTVVNLKPHAGDGVLITPFLLVAQTQAAANRLRELKTRPGMGIGREVPANEVRRLSPGMSTAVEAAWEPVEHFAFSSAEAPFTPRGQHGLWPTRPGYRSTYLLWGSGIRARRLPEMEMTSIAERFAAVLGVAWPPPKQRR